MARGDVVSDIQSIAGAANLDFQPAAGVEVMITEVGSGNFTGTLPDKIPNVSVALYNGTLASFLRDNGSTQLWTKEMKIFINNTRYLRITNGSGSNQSLSYCGVQTK